MTTSASRASVRSSSKKAFLPKVSIWNRIAEVTSDTASSSVSPSPTTTPRIPTGYATKPSGCFSLNNNFEGLLDRIPSWYFIGTKK